MVSVAIVTWNSVQLLDECFAALAAQDYRDLEVIIVDNASTDGTCAVLRTIESSWRIIYNQKNVGFAAGQNQAIRSSRGEWVLCLNPDVVMSPDFITQLVAAGEAHSDAGSLCGKLLRWNAVGRVEQAFRPASSVNFDNSSGAEVCDLSPRTGLFTRADAGLKARSTDPSSDLVRKPDESSPPSLLYHTIAADPRRTNIIDSTGIYFTRNMRHLDRGAEEIDRGQYDRVQYVFGATGAAALFRRGFIEDVSVEGEFFDEDFFAFREDADLAWRAQLMGWKCLYVPSADCLARAACDARAPRKPAAGDQLALGKEPLPDARQERVGMAVLAAFLSRCLARPDDLRLRPVARPSNVVGRDVSVESAR